MGNRAAIFEGFANLRRTATVQVSALFLLLIVFASGCSDHSSTEVSGKVTLDGVSVERGVISFWPADGTGPSAQAVIQDGDYKVAVAPGAKHVQIEVAEKTGERAMMELSHMKVPVYEPVLLHGYQAVDDTDLLREITPTSTVHNFQLRSS